MSGLKDSEIIATVTKHSSADSFEYPNEELEGFTSCEVCGHFVPTEEISEVLYNGWWHTGDHGIHACCRQCNPLYAGDYEKPLFSRILSIFLHEVVFVPVIITGMVVVFAILYSLV